MKCHYTTCHGDAQWLPVISLRSLVSLRELRQPFAQMCVCERHKGWVAQSLLSEPWFDGYAKIVERQHKFLPNRRASRVIMMNLGQIGESA